MHVAQKSKMASIGEIQHNYETTTDDSFKTPIRNTSSQSIEHLLSSNHGQCTSNESASWLSDLSTTPTCAQLASMNLTYGQNNVKLLNHHLKKVITLKIFVWSCGEKVVITDIDGTISKSDTRGMILPSFGIKWSHVGVSELLNNLFQSGYSILYLSARSFKVSDPTRTYLKLLNLPPGPLLLSPTGIWNSLTTELYYKNPEEAKLNHLISVAQLFPDTCKPFAAGFGNSANDLFCYNSVGVTPERIFMVNKDSEVSVNGKKNQLL